MRVSSRADCCCCCCCCCCSRPGHSRIPGGARYSRALNCTPHSKRPEAGRPGAGRQAAAAPSQPRAPRSPSPTRPPDDAVAGHGATRGGEQAHLILIARPPPPPCSAAAPALRWRRSVGREL
eukprot:scaffold99_cov382-Prasinococcus_capsulatus_cf.AAC.5